MKTHLTKQGSRGITRFEVIIVVAVLLVLAAVYVPYRHARLPQRSARLSCVNLLNQVGLAFRIWSGDNNDKYPMSVSVTNGGTMELVDSGTVWQHFKVMSNELNTPKLLVCPHDLVKDLATTWGITASAKPGEVVFSGNLNTSYFVGVDADPVRPQMFLAGDRNLTLTNTPLGAGLHSLLASDPVGWGKDLHKNQGNVLMADGSVQIFNPLQLRTALSRTGVVTNRLAVP